MRYLCSKSDMKWISLMLWAGTDAGALGPRRRRCVRR
jgi:hypothetical protein